MANGTKMEIFNSFITPKYKEVPEVLAELGKQIWGQSYGVSNDNITAPVSWKVSYTCSSGLDGKISYTKEALTPNMVIYAYLVAENSIKGYKQELEATRDALELALRALNNSSAIHYKDPAMGHLRGNAIDAISAALERKVVDWLPPKV